MKITNSNILAFILGVGLTLVVIFGRPIKFYQTCNLIDSVEVTGKKLYFACHDTSQDILYELDTVRKGWDKLE